MEVKGVTLERDGLALFPDANINSGVPRTNNGAVRLTAQIAQIYHIIISRAITLHKCYVVQDSGF